MPSLWYVAVVSISVGFNKPCLSCMPGNQNLLERDFVLAVIETVGHLSLFDIFLWKKEKLSKP